MRALEFIIGHVIYNPANTSKFQLKTTEIWLKVTCKWKCSGVWKLKNYLVKTQVHENKNAILEINSTLFVVSFRLL